MEKFLKDDQEGGQMQWIMFNLIVNPKSTVIIENGKAIITYLRGIEPNLTSMREAWSSKMHMSEHKCVKVNVKLKEISHIDVFDIDKWIWENGLSFGERGRLVAWRVSKRIKNKDNNGELRGESTHELNSDPNLQSEL